jgi:hypothetical protein
MPQNTLRRSHVDQTTPPSAISRVSSGWQLATPNCPLAAELGRVLELAGSPCRSRHCRCRTDGASACADAGLRADVVTESDRADALLALAPEARGGFYLVPKVIE